MDVYCLQSFFPSINAGYQGGQEVNGMFTNLVYDSLTDFSLWQKVFFLHTYLLTVRKYYVHFAFMFGVASSSCNIVCMKEPFVARGRHA